jgi:hypothetical protein
MVLMGYSGARGTLIHEKNLMSKVSCQTPFNGLRFDLREAMLEVLICIATCFICVLYLQENS